MKEAIKIGAVVAAALLLAACAKKEEAAAPMPEPAASAPLEAPPAEAAPMSEDSAMMDAAPAMGEGEDAERAGGDKVAPQASE